MTNAQAALIAAATLCDDRALSPYLREEAARETAERFKVWLDNQDERYLQDRVDKLLGAPGARRTL